MKSLFAVLAVLVTATPLAAQTAAPSPLAPQYREGDTVRYHMTATNDGWHYTADATAVTAKTANGTFVETFRWTAMTSNGQPATLSPAMLSVGQPLTRDPNVMPSPPDLSKVDHQMIGPVTDLMTFYVDAWLGNKFGLQHAGDHFYMPNPMPSSWADGTHVVTGSDHIDFDLTLAALDPATQTAVLVVRHVPPAHPNLRFPAAWMQDTVADSPNNWVEVTKTDGGKFSAAMGKETFDVKITISTADGRIVSATMDNVVTTRVRECTDAALTHCGDARPQTIHRQIAIARVK